ncbi:class I SAM-dependent methyltransferase [Polynucleobacter sp. HIN5]|uniref:class I SAM-dependent methyltransferase n=1 Tax=Polynucleobacter sp. HIN5 TaxID=3047864 RepID=UPI002572DEC8|nr:methyltransferase domain-containing protein [Polynucleobacter sp. HIN5]BEI32949.1 hypothetical protein PHIN5_03170 [Polynucleobacter sp. HIN5]
MQNIIAVHYGCGWCAPSNWHNFDASPTLRFEKIPFIGRFSNKNANKFPQNVKYGDICFGLPFPDNSCDYVYCSHVLEHLSLMDFRKAISNTHSLLKKNGVFRLVVPDLAFLVNEYISDKSADSSIKFLQNSYLGRVRRNRGLKNFVFDYFGNSNHLWMWDYPSLAEELKKVGFSYVRRAFFNDSVHNIFDSVEEFSRWDNALGIECIK